jgi:uncharacterized glyoxalase superfamily protein PhnB
VSPGGEIRVIVGAFDYDVSRGFYGDVLGFPVHEVWDEDDGRGTLFRAGAGIIEVIEDSPHHPAARPQGVALALEADDVDALYERVRERGVEVTDPIADRPWGHRNFEVRDPAGLPLVFFSIR